MRKTWREPFLNFVGIHVLALYIVAVALISRYWVAPFLP